MIVVTGGAGFIGSNIVAGLSENGEKEIVVCDRLGSGEKWRNLAGHEVADIIAPEDLLRFLDDRAGGIDAVIHMGAVTSTTERDLDRLIADNFRFSLELWHWCAERGVRLIYASSAATYGDGSQGFTDDDSVAGLGRLCPLNAYGWSKHLFDRRVARMVADGRSCPPQWVGLKFFNVYGPNEYHKGPMSSVARHIFAEAAAGRPARLFKSYRPACADGGQQRDFIWVEDCVDVVRWLLANRTVNGLYNLGTGTARSFADLAAAVFAALERPPEITYVDMPPEIRDRYQYFTQADIGRLRAAGYGPEFTSVEEGVGRYVREYLNSADPYR